MLKILKNHKGQITLTDFIILLATITLIASIAANSTSDSIVKVDQGYQSKIKSFFIQGE